MAKSATKKAKRDTKPTGRPKAEIDQKAFEGLCVLQCSKREMSNFFNVSDRTLERWCVETYKEPFVEVFTKKRVGGLISHRRAGFKLAQSNAAVWIFCSKNWLGMKDVPDDPEGAESVKPVKITIVERDASRCERPASEVPTCAEQV